MSENYRKIKSENKASDHHIEQRTQGFPSLTFFRPGICIESFTSVDFTTIEQKKKSSPLYS